MNTATVYRRTLTPKTNQMVIDVPEEFRGRSVEVIVLPVIENSAPEQASRLPQDILPMFSKTQIEEWARSPEIQALSGVLKNAGLPDDIDVKKIRAMRIVEKYGVSTEY
jgi:putative transposon-encoded protein